jgi:hypothetical protein
VYSITRSVNARAVKRAGSATDASDAARTFAIARSRRDDDLDDDDDDDDDLDIDPNVVLVVVPMVVTPVVITHARLTRAVAFASPRVTVLARITRARVRVLVDTTDDDDDDDTDDVDVIVIVGVVIGGVSFLRASSSTSSRAREPINHPPRRPRRADDDLDEQTWFNPP